MLLTQYRKPSVDGVTVSKMFLGAEFLYYVIEDEVREKPGVSVANWKVPGKTAIPAGKYEIVLQDSVRFGPGTPTLLNVPGFTHIRIHSGNSEKDTEGCLIIGLELDSSGKRIKAGTTRPAVLALKALLNKYYIKGERVWIDISQPALEA